MATLLCVTVCVMLRVCTPFTDSDIDTVYAVGSKILCVPPASQVNLICVPNTFFMAMYVGTRDSLNFEPCNTDVRLTDIVAVTACHGQSDKAMEIIMQIQKA